MKKMLLLFCILCCLLSSCHKEETLKNVDYLVFGFFNMSWGLQCENYKLTADGIFEPSSACNADTLVFKISPMSDANFEVAKALIGDIPESLFNGDQTDFQGESCADCGGYCLEISKGGVVRKFSFGTITSQDWPDEIRDFWSEVTGVMAQLPK